MKNYIVKFSFFLMLVFAFGCNQFDEIDAPIDAKREIAVPLFYSTTTLPDLLNGFNDETFITMGPDDLITLNYRGNVAKKDAVEFFAFVQDVIIPMADSVIAAPYQLSDALDITLMRLKSGLMGYSFKNSYDEPLEVTLDIPQLTKNGESFKKTEILAASGEANSSILKAVGLSGYQLTSENDTVYMKYEAYLQSTGERVLLTEELPWVALTNVEFEYAEGYWGQEVLDLDRDTINIEFFENWVQGDVYFENPKIELRVDNSFGFPVRSVVSVLDILTVNNEMITLESPFIDNGIDFGYPSLSEIGEVKTTIFDFTKENSNIVDVMSSSPVSVDYDVDAVSNPDALPEIGFITDSSYFRVQLAVDLPFRGRVNNFKARDVFDVDFDNYNDVEYIEFKMIAENNIPLGIDIQLYFADENETIIDSLYLTHENILEAAPVDADGNTTGVTSEKTTFATIDAAKFNKIRYAKKLIAEGVFFTTDATSSTPAIVNLKANQEVHIRMGMKVGTK
ncbi:MAG TPA: hypothetical protein ENJ53_08675 [Phaeodactylibacter sp.]|nr:hypothetical protein [Phaeodactylibacter sp.]